MKITGSDLDLDRLLLVHVDRDIIYATVNKDDALTKVDVAKKKFPKKDIRLSTIHNYGRICWGKGHNLSVD